MSRDDRVRNQVGELVIKAPWIGMTRGFWKDPQRILKHLLVALAEHLGAWGFRRGG